MPDPPRFSRRTPIRTDNPAPTYAWACITSGCRKRLKVLGPEPNICPECLQPLERVKVTQR